MSRPAKYISAKELNGHLRAMKDCSAKIDSWKEALKNKALDKSERDKIGEKIEFYTKGLKKNYSVMMIKRKFFYQNNSGIPLAEDSEHRQHHIFTEDEYMRLKNADFRREEIARASYYQLQRA